MQTKILTITEKQVSKEHIDIAADILRQGGTVAFPTETVYGLGANALDISAVEGIFKAKGRPGDNPLIVHIVDMNQMDKLVNAVPKKAIKLAQAFWPGPLTMVFKKLACVPNTVTAGLDTVAIRIPAHPVAQQLIRTANIPIAAPSANRSGKPSPTTAKHVIQDLLGKIDAIVDGGNATVGLESTVIDMTAKMPVLLRPGSITLEQIREVVGEVDVAQGVLEALEKSAIVRSPGMKYTHYAPTADVVVVEGEMDKVVVTINNLIKQEKQNGRKVGVLSMDETIDAYHDVDYILSVGSQKRPETIAANLFAQLREFDKTDVEIIFAQSVSNEGIGMAIRNRLNKASGYRVVKVN